MAIPVPPPKPSQRSNQKQTVLGAAEGQILQVQVIDSNRTNRVIAVYRCGPTVQWGNSLGELFSAPKDAPQWLLDGLNRLPEDRFIRIAPAGTPSQDTGFDLTPVSAGDAEDF